MPPRLLGAGPETTSWLWTFWHVGPPVYAIGFALAERHGPGKQCAPNQAKLLLVAVSACLVAFVLISTLVVTEWVDALPTIVRGDDYSALTTSGIGPAVELLTLVALGILWAATRLRTTLQLWVAVSLFLLVLDNGLTLFGAARGSVGWTFGRLEALISASLVLLVYLHQTGLLHRQVSAGLQTLGGTHDELRAAHMTLEAQAKVLRETGQELAAARTVADQANAAKSRFLASMSHDLRTPLTAIIGFSDLLMQQETSEAERRSYLALQREAAGTLMDQIGNVLDIMKIEAGRLELEQVPFSLRALIEGSVGIVSQTAKTKQLQVLVSLDPTLPEWVRGDPTRLRQVLLNFLSNAIKFTFAGSITILVEIQPEAGANEVRLRLAVRDTGVGVAADALPRLFQDYTQAETSTTRQFGGTGLGLSISRQIIEQMDGRVGVVSTPGKGSTFWFELTLPLAAQPISARPPLPQQATGRDLTAQRPLLRLVERRRVLVVDDVKPNQVLLRAIMQRLGYEVDVADNGADAVDAARRTSYDLILMDIQMPVLDGIGATRQIPRPRRDRSPGSHPRADRL